MNQKTESSASIGRTSPSQFKHDGNNESMSPARETRPMIRLGDAFVPTRFDVMCGRGKMSHHHVGNHRFRDIIERNLKRYNKATNKITKSDVVTDIVESVRQEAAVIGGAGFVRQESSSGNNGEAYWVEIGDTLAREKVGHALRDSIKNRKKRSERKPKVEPPFQYEKQQAMFHKQQNIFLKSLKEDMGKDHQETTDYVMDYFRGAKAAPSPKTPTTTTKASSNNRRKKKSNKKVAKITFTKQEPMSPPLARRITAEGDALVKLQEDAGFPVATSPILRRVSTDDIDTHDTHDNDDTPVLTEEHTPPPPPPPGKDHSRRVSLTDVDYNVSTPDLTAQHHDDCGGIDGFILQDDLALPLFEDEAMILGDIVPDHAASVTHV